WRRGSIARSPCPCSSRRGSAKRRPGGRSRRSLAAPRLGVAAAAWPPGTRRPRSLGGDLRGWRLVFSDEFNGPSGSAIDGSKWSAETGGHGWGNSELQHYTNRLENVRQESGAMVISATPQGADQ